MGIMDNEGHDPMGFGNVRSARAMQADPDPQRLRKQNDMMRAALTEIQDRAATMNNGGAWAGGLATLCLASCHEQKLNIKEG